MDSSPFCLLSIHSFQSILWNMFTTGHPPVANMLTPYSTTGTSQSLWWHPHPQQATNFALFPRKASTHRLAFVLDEASVDNWGHDTLAIVHPEFDYPDYTPQAPAFVTLRGGGRAAAKKKQTKKVLSLYQEKLVEMIPWLVGLLSAFVIGVSIVRSSFDECLSRNMYHCFFERIGCVLVLIFVLQIWIFFYDNLRPKA